MVSHWNLELLYWATLAGQRAPQIFLSQPAFYVGARDAMLVLLLASKHYLHWAFSSVYISFFFFPCQWKTTTQALTLALMGQTCEHRSPFISSPLDRVNRAPFIFSAQGQLFCPLLGHYLNIFLIATVSSLVRHQRMKPDSQHNIFQNPPVILEKQ